MANRRLFQFLYSRQPKLTMMTGGFTVGASGTVASGSVFGAGIYSITQPGSATGVYQIKLQDNYYAFVGAQFQAYAAPGAVTTNVSGLTGSSVYQIASVGNSTWSTVGLDTDYTAAVGQPFVATAVAGSGTGTAKLLGPTNIESFEVLQNPAALLQNLNPSMGKGTSVLFQTMATTAATAVTNTSTFTTTLTRAASNAVGSSMISFKLWFRDSSATP